MVDADTIMRVRALVGLERFTEMVQAQARARAQAERAGEVDIREQIKRGSFRAFIRWAWRLAEPQPLVWGVHLDVLADELQALAAVFVPRLRHTVPDLDARVQPDGALLLVICMPPGFAKSLVCSVLLPAFLWLHAPWLRSQYISSNDDWAKRDSSRTRDIVRSIEYQALADEIARENQQPTWRIKKGEDENVNYYTTERGHRYAALIEGQSATGGRAHLQVIDDPLDANAIVTGSAQQVDARSRRAVGIISVTLSTRGVVGYPFCRVIVQQRLTDTDPAAWAIASGWRPVILPMRYNPDLDARHGGPHPLDRRQPGELLCAALKSEAEVATMEKSLGVHAEAQLGQSPRRGGKERIARTLFANRYTASPLEMAATCSEVWISVDAAKKGKATSDLHAMHVWGFRDEVAIFLARRAGRWDYPTFEHALDGLYMEWAPYVRRGPGGVLVEDTANGGTYLQCRRGRIHNLTAFHPNETPGTDKGKAARFTYFENKAAAGQILTPTPTIMPEIEQVIDYWTCFTGEEGETDDDCDAVSQLLVRRAIDASRRQVQVAYYGWTPPGGTR